MADIFRDRLLQDKVAFITGGGSGINLRIAERFAAQGAKLGLMGRKQDKLDRAAAGIRAAGGAALGIAGDVRTTRTAKRARPTHDEFGRSTSWCAEQRAIFQLAVLGMSANGFKSGAPISSALPRSRMVRASSSACVGCSCVPSPALTIGIPSDAAESAAPRRPSAA